MLFYAPGAVVLNLTSQGAAQSKLPACPPTGVCDDCQGETTLKNEDHCVGGFRDDRRSGMGVFTDGPGSAQGLQCAIRPDRDLGNPPSPGIKGALSGRFLTEVDCQEQRARTVQSALFISARLGDRLINRSNHPGRWDSVAPQGAEVMPYVCEH